MSLANILEYPEFLAAALLAIAFLATKFTGSPALEPTINPFQSAAMAFFSLFPAKYQQWVTRLINWANWRGRSAAAEFAGLKLMLAIACLFFVFIVPPYAALLFSSIAYFVPDLFLLNAVRVRQQKVRDALPQALDLMVLCVDAGLGLDATVQRIASDRSAVNQALNEELASLGRDVLLGMERGRAYLELYRRTGVEELKMLGSALNQSTKMGLSIAKILRAQGDFLRARQSQRAEERAAKLPVWMSFPLWFCIMPALLFVIIGPSLITFTQHMGNVKLDIFH